MCQIVVLVGSEGNTILSATNEEKSRLLLYWTTNKVNGF
jgi:hypothetical protein